MATDADSPSEQSRGRGRRVPAFRLKGDLHLSEQKRGCVLGEVRFEFSHLLLSDIDVAFRSTGVLFANLMFEDCSFESGSSGSIVEVENCSSRQFRDTIQFHHISFRKNTLIKGTGLAMQSPSCFELELIDFVVERNRCDGRCGVILSRQNRLRDIVIRNNKPYDPEKTNTVLFYAPPGSETSMDGINSTQNSCPSINVEGGSLNMTKAVFYRNSIPIGQNGANSAPLQLKNAKASIKDCLCRQNEAEYGGAISVEKNSLCNITDCQFNKNNASAKGGAIFVRDSVLSVQKCSFTEGSATDGGGIYAPFSNISVEDTSASNLSARNYGGFLSGIISEIRMQNCLFSDNMASDGGGVIECDSHCRLSDTGSKYTGNSAEFGGAIYVAGSDLSVQKCNFTEGSAIDGGGIYASSSSVFVENTFATDLFAGSGGGFISGETSRIRIQNCLFSNNMAAEGGGVIECDPDCRFSDTGSHYSGNAAEFGGAIYVADSDLSVQKCNFTEGSARNGGGIYALSSDVSIRRTEAFDMFASGQGGAIYSSESVFKIINTQISHCEAGTDGGAVMGKHLSRLLCSGCTLIENKATRGGAIFFQFKSIRSISIQLDNSIVLNNSAEYGGMHDKANEERCTLFFT